MNKLKYDIIILGANTNIGHLIFKYYENKNNILLLSRSDLTYDFDNLIHKYIKSNFNNEISLDLSEIILGDNIYLFDCVSVANNYLDENVYVENLIEILNSDIINKLKFINMLTSSCNRINIIWFNTILSIVAKKNRLTYGAAKYLYYNALRNSQKTKNFNLRIVQINNKINNIDEWMNVLDILIINLEKQKMNSFDYIEYGYPTKIIKIIYRLCPNFLFWYAKLKKRKYFR